MAAWMPARKTRVAPAARPRRARRSSGKLLTHLVATLSAVGIAGAQQTRPMSVADIMGIKIVGDAAISPDGREVLYTVTQWELPPGAADDRAQGGRPERRSHVWLVSSEPSASAARELTPRGRDASSPKWSPDARLVSFVADRPAEPGREARPGQLWLMRRDGSEARPLTIHPDRVGSPRWSPDGTRVAYVVADSLPADVRAAHVRGDDERVWEADFRLSHVWVVDVASGQTREVAHGSFTVAGSPEWSPDGARIAFRASPTSLARETRSDVYLVTVATGAIEQLTTDAALQSNPVWSPDGRTLAYTRRPHAGKPNPDGFFDNSNDNARLALLDVGRRLMRDVSSPSFDRSVGQPHWSPDGKRLWFTVDDGVFFGLYDYDVPAARYTQRLRRLVVREASLSRDGSRWAFIIESPTSPSDVYVMDATALMPRRATNTNPQLAGVALGEQEVITWRSDGGTVEGVLLKPVGYQPGKRYPLLVDIHGGPTYLHWNGFKAMAEPDMVIDAGQYWAGKGWAVLYPNPRGSAGYGQKFARANIKDFGGGDYRDIMAGTDALVRRGIADPARLAVSGWSYGGYLTAWTITQTRRFKAAMVGAGFVDNAGFYGSTDVPNYIGGTFFGDIPNPRTIALYRARSPVTYAAKITTPLLILHGADEVRVPFCQALEFYRALKDRGKTVELVAYPREFHFINEYFHQADRIEREYRWVARYTLDERAAAVR